MKIIISGKGYPEKRNIVTDVKKTYIDFHSRNIWTYINAFRGKILKRNKLFIFSAPLWSAGNDKKVVHLFNEVATSRGRWVSTFETELPRVLPVPGVAKTANPLLKKLMRHVAAPDCAGIIAISEATRKIELKLLDAFPIEREAIADKLHVLHPPQPVLYEGGRAPAADKMVFTFVGNEFYRKGGAEVVMAFSELMDEGAISADQISVNLIGDIKKQHNIAHHEWQDDADFHHQIETLIAERSVFTHHTGLPNDAVMQLLRNTHVGLLPTWQDTYGFSVLEMQACGCPVITTNVRALPEINPAQSGWLINCPLNDMFELNVDTLAEKMALRILIVSQLKAHIKAILEDRMRVADYSAAAVNRIRQHHDPDKFNRALSAIYGAKDTRSSFDRSEAGTLKRS
ncbi:MAG: glycosyl transferase [Pantoea eucrina]|jgi:glycosyltransferase involved in cell wall biosynthesis|uniref:glycosyltransferase n=1 Tax=Pantoea sp. SIMBA_079 TaxID=3085817 RepID=UPI0039922266|nr:glycosyl transferase [Pantoea eucrina]